MAKKSRALELAVRPGDIGALERMAGEQQDTAMQLPVPSEIAAPGASSEEKPVDMRDLGHKVKNVVAELLESPDLKERMAGAKMALPYAIQPVAFGASDGATDALVRVEVVVQDVTDEDRGTRAMRISKHTVHKRGGGRPRKKL